VNNQDTTPVKESPFFRSVNREYHAIVENSTRKGMADVDYQVHHEYLAKKDPCFVKMRVEHSSTPRIVKPLDRLCNKGVDLCRVSNNRV